MTLFKKRKKIEDSWGEDAKTVGRTTEREKLTVEILGKGFHPVSVDTATTIRDLRNALNLDSNIQAVDESGKRLSDSDRVTIGVGKSSSGIKKKISFVPNVRGG